MELTMKSHLSPARQQLLGIIQSLGFGVIEELTIINGEPCFASAPKILQDIKIGSSEVAPRADDANRDFALKSRVVELFGHLDRLDAVKVTIEVKHSSPFRIVVEHNPQATIDLAKIR